MPHILIQNEQLEQVDTFPYLGSLITEDGECTTEFRTRLMSGGGFYCPDSASLLYYKGSASLNGIINLSACA